jgi:hypothetical protein
VAARLIDAAEAGALPALTSALGSSYLLHFRDASRHRARQRMLGLEAILELVLVFQASPRRAGAPSLRQRGSPITTLLDRGARRLSEAALALLVILR